MKGRILLPMVGFKKTLSIWCPLSLDKFLTNSKTRLFFNKPIIKYITEKNNPICGIIFDLNFKQKTKLKINIDVNTGSIIEMILHEILELETGQYKLVP